jgi:small basic protein
MERDKHRMAFRFLFLFCGALVAITRLSVAIELFFFAILFSIMIRKLLSVLGYYFVLAGAKLLAIRVLWNTNYIRRVNFNN